MAVVCSNDALEVLPKILDSRNCRRIFLVTGRASYDRSGARKALDRILKPYQVTHFSDVEENPKLEQLELALAKFRESESDLIIGVGGGSVLDMAKLVKIFAAQPEAPSSYAHGQATLSASGLPLVAVPTTAGSGSQATHFAVLYIGKTKYSVAHHSMLPDEALVDPELLSSVPPSVAASTGLDALNQGIESYWSIHSTDKSKAMAREAIELAWRNLRSAVGKPDSKVRAAMATAAHRAGEAINITKTTAPHAISYPITSYFGVPHGHAVGLILGRVLVYNDSVSAEDCLDARGPAYVRTTIAEIAAMMGESDATDAARSYNALMDDIGMSRNFKTLGIATRQDLETIISNGFNPQRVNNNPRRVTEASLRKMLLELQAVD